MVNKKLANVLNFFKDNIGDDVFDIKMQKKLLFDILNDANNVYEEFKEKIRIYWQEFKDNYQNRIIKKTFTNFFNDNFHDFFKFYLEHFFGFEANSLELILKQRISDTILILEYNYYLSTEEIEQYDRIANSIKGNLYGTLFFTGYLFYLVAIFGIIIRKSINKRILTTLDCAVIKTDNNHKYLNFLILTREDRQEILTNYSSMTSFYFFKQFKDIPDDYFKELLLGREKLYQLALNDYPSVKEKLADLLYYFYYKCKVLENVCPLLDFLNFVCSRVEDSVFDKIDIIKKDFFVNLDYTTEKKNALINIFKFLDSRSTLYSTFLANHLPGQKAQLNLFLLYMKYYFATGLEALEVGDILFLPDKFRTAFNQNNKEQKSAIDAKAIMNIGEFMNFFYNISNIKNANLFFKKIFNKSISQMNYRFFRSFLKSFNVKLTRIIDQENKNLNNGPGTEPFTFNIVVDHICRILYNLIDRIFIRTKPEMASQNFIDPRGRYIGKNIALRVLELFIFQEINYSDDIWPEYLVSLKKTKLQKDLEKYVKISDDYFYSDKELMQVLTIFNFQSFSNAIFFEEWLIKEVIVPLNDFILKVKNSIVNLSNRIEIYNKLTEIMLKDIDPEDKDIIQDFKLACQVIARFWEDIN
ncbi:MAG: hypothetical protein ACFFAH_13005 [Promethearchaeota archaeon]